MNEEDAEKDAVQEELLEDEKVDLVDLIEQPAWKSILIDLVKREKMNPWDIDVAELADKYLQKINSMERKDLRVPANAILASAILLKMKSKTLRLTSLEELEDEIEEQAIEQERLMLDETLPELRSMRKLREGKVSLDELVIQIESILEKTKKNAYKDREKELPKFIIPNSIENINERIDALFEKIQQRVDSQGLVLFSALVDEKTPVEMVNTFIPLLFLIDKGKVVAWQEKFFGEIFISLCNENNKF